MANSVRRTPGPPGWICVPAGLSTLCLIHCLALPLLVSLLPLAAQSFDSHFLHQILALAAVPVSARVMWKALPVGGNVLSSRRQRRA